MSESATALFELLEKYRANARTERGKGTRFEELAKVYFESDAVQKQEYEKAWTYSEWAAEQGIDKNDDGIDLVAKMKDGGYCAIQCKFYASDHTIQKSDIDSFFTASGKKPFTRRIIIDTTEGAYGKNAEKAMLGQQIETLRIDASQIAYSNIDWSQYLRDEVVTYSEKKSPYPHQQEAVEAVKEAFQTESRGKIIMACGTGKTYTSLCIAEDWVGSQKKSGMVLFLVPSLALMSQTVTEWKNDCSQDFTAFAVCSDSQIGVRRVGQDDIGDMESFDLAFPATTSAGRLAEKVAQHGGDGMTVVFATYHSLQRISEAQKEYNLPPFDLIICDEAHRTTGATLEGDEDSNFVAVHKDDFIQAEKRLYMTATPRIYGDEVKKKAAEYSAELASMDDESIYGKVIFHRGFGWAVEHQMLTDYKVIVLAVDEEMVSAGVQGRLSEDSELLLDDATKIIGCYKALTKENLKIDLSHDPAPMKRALAFCKTIKASQTIEREFAHVVDEYLNHQEEEGLEPSTKIACELEHVDGTFKAKERTKLLEWIKAESPENTARILTNAKCLSEGVDVPALDAIMFLHPRKSQVDVVQSVGRVMRRAKGKKLGYVILPVGVPAGKTPEEALKDNEKYKVVWQILNALRAHDERFDATINKAGLGEDVSDAIEVVAVSNNLPARTPEPATPADIGGGAAAGDDDTPTTPPAPAPTQAIMQFDEFSQAIMAKIVKKCGTRDYWEDWAKDIAVIAEKHIIRIKSVVAKEGSHQRQAFLAFLEELRDDLNGDISEMEAIEMLAQHLITKPVFETLFQGHNFTEENPVSRAMQTVLASLKEDNIEKESESLEKFYASVKRRAAGIETAQGRQELIVQLYDKFFRAAFPKLTEKLGIVYTPVEVVDFIIHSVNDVLANEFGQTLGSKGVHILDPFTGTGTFITRLLQSGLIKPEELEHKYKEEIHANEIVLLAYYIAAINVEAAYHELAGETKFTPFNGICLTDTFQMYEKQDMIQKLMPDNSQRRIKQRELDIRVIMGNPPYSAGQKSANDNAANVSYPHLDSRIQETYVHESLKKGGKKSTYDSYIRAIRWGSDRLGDAGVMAYVTNAGWLESNAADGLRKCLEDEFSSLYVFHLRGNARTAGELRRKEKGNVFGEGTRTPIAITIHVKNPKAKEHGQIYFLDIGDYLSQKDKLAIVKNYHRNNSNKQDKWKTITPDEHHDWLNQRDDSFNKLLVMVDKKNKSTAGIFENYSSGVLTSRDAWNYNHSYIALKANIERFIGFYNSQVSSIYKGVILEKDAILSQISDDKTKINWGENLKSNLRQGRSIDFEIDSIVRSSYRPFGKSWLYYNADLNHSLYSMPHLFPSKNIKNVVISVTGQGESRDFCCLVTDIVPNYHYLATGNFFPLKLYEPAEADNGELFDNSNKEANNTYTERDGITNAGLTHFQDAYPSKGEGESISKEDLFYYIYGILHSPEYREKYANNLSKELPRIPAVKGFADFQAYSKAGRELAELHIGYETVEKYPVTMNGVATGGKGKGFDSLMEDFTDEDYYVKKMKFKGTGKNKDRSIIIYNTKITLSDIPLEAYDYIVNGKPAIEWVMDRQCVKTDNGKNGSGIVNDANDYAKETVGNAAYPLELIQRVITVSLETMKLVNALPKLEISE